MNIIKDAGLAVGVLTIPVAVTAALLSFAGANVPTSETFDAAAPAFAVQRQAEMLDPTIRIKAPEEKSSGSGTVIYSQPNGKGEYVTYALTNLHVVGKNATLEGGKFDGYYTVIANTFNATSDTVPLEVVAGSFNPDLALVKFVSNVRYPVARIISDPSRVYLTEDVWSVGASKGFTPTINYGFLGDLNGELTPGYTLRRTTAIIQPGNSGGGLYHLANGHYELIGVPGMGLNFSTGNPMMGGGAGVVTAASMSWAVDATDIRAFLDAKGYSFILSTQDANV